MRGTGRTSRPMSQRRRLIDHSLRSDRLDALRTFCGVRVLFAKACGPADLVIRGGSLVFCFLNVSGARTLERVYLERDFDIDAQAHQAVRRLRLSERSEMVTRISRMMDVWPLMFAALVTLVVVRVVWETTRIVPRETGSQALVTFAAVRGGDGPNFLSVREVDSGESAVGKKGWSSFFARLGRTGASLEARVGRPSHNRVSICASSHALFRKGLPKGPAWGLFVWDLVGVGADLMPIRLALSLPGTAGRMLSAWK